MVPTPAESQAFRSEGGFRAERYLVAPVVEAVAKRFVVQHHYAGSFPAARFSYGLFDTEAPAMPGEPGQLVGVAVLSVPVSNSVLFSVFPRLEPNVESLELSRLVLLDVAPGNSELVPGALLGTGGAPGRARRGQLQRPGAAMDDGRRARLPWPHRHHLPGEQRRVPRADGAAAEALLPDGRVLSERALSKVRADDRGHAYVERELMGFGARPRRPGEAGAAWLREALPAVGVRSVVHGGNHRYAFRIGARRRLVAVGLLAAAYPKAVAA